MTLSFPRTTERDPLWRREMRERWRRPITLFFLTLYVAGLCWFAYSLYSTLVPVGDIQLSEQTRGVGHQLFTSLMSTQIGIWVPTALMLAAPTVAAERERRAIIEYFLAGLLPYQIVRAKFASIATFIVVMCAVPVPILSLCYPLGGVEPLELVAGVLFEISIAIACASVGLWISVTNRRVVSAMQSAIIFSIVFLMLVVMLVPPILELPFVIWLLFTVGLVFAAGVVLMGCVDILGHVSRRLEEEERGFNTAPAYSSAPPPLVQAPPPPLKPLQKPVQPQPTATVSASATPTFNKLQEDLLEGSSWDLWIEKVASFNAIAVREVRVGLRASRMRMALSPDSPTYQFSPWAWSAFGACGAIFVWLTSMSAWWYFALVIVTVGALIAAASGASAAFTREREQKMFAQLRLCPMSALEVVAGKVAAMLLLVIRSWGGPLLGLFIMGLSQGVGIALTATLLVVLSLLLVISLATLLSLLCHHTSIATIGTLGTVLILFLLLPSAPSSLGYFFPWVRIVLTSFPLGPMWVQPINALMRPPSYGLSTFEAVFRISGSLVMLITLCLLASARTWSRSSPDEGEAKTSFWQRDISRSLR